MNINAGRNTMTSTPVGNVAPQANVFRGPEVYTLADQANDAIPAEIRDRFHTDEHGKVVLFTQPPDAAPSSGLSHESEGLGHSARYLANREKYLARKQQRRDEINAQKKLAELRRAANMPEGQEREDEINRLVDTVVAGIKAWTASHTKETERLFKQLGVPPSRITAGAQSN
jgi:chromatin structure-remodeling complex subunit RSC1/2